jgi:hypothetical protein
VNDDVSKVNQQPTIFRNSFHPAAYLKRFLNHLNGRIGQSFDCPVTGTGTYDKVFGKNRNFLNIDQDDIFPLFVF